MLEPFCTRPGNVEQNYTLEVPVVYEVEVDGKQEQRTKMDTEERTRTLTLLKELATPLAPTSYRLYEMAGNKLAPTTTDRFAEPEAIVYVPKGKIVDPWCRKVLRRDAVLLIQR